jgi:hypothetical protein
MYSQIYHITNADVLLAEKYFSQEYCENLKSKTSYRESLVARYYISRMIEKYYSIK